jgi:Sec-independent protein translocase protein TatA
MLDLSPVKLLLFLVVAMVLLGPDKLPQVARQLGAGWRKLQEFRERIDREVRENIPDLPSTHDIARLARSPVALLNELASYEARTDLVEDPGAAPGPAGEGWPEDPGAEAPGDRRAGGTVIGGGGGANGAAGASGAGGANGERGASGSGAAEGPAWSPAPAVPVPDDPGMN